jgi:hypothetical protein
MIAYCGLTCTDCPAFKATQKNDDQARVQVAEMWSKEFKVYLRPEDINCDGCLSDNGRRFNYCQVCEIRKCGQDKLVQNCAFCDDYACEKLTAFFAMGPGAKSTLDKIRESL